MSPRRQRLRALVPWWSNHSAVTGEAPFRVHCFAFTLPLCPSAPWPLTQELRISDCGLEERGVGVRSPEFGVRGSYSYGNCSYDDMSRSDRCGNVSDDGGNASDRRRNRSDRCGNPSDSRRNRSDSSGNHSVSSRSRSDSDTRLSDSRGNRSDSDPSRLDDDPSRSDSDPNHSDSRLCRPPEDRIVCQHQEGRYYRACRATG